MSLMRNVAAAAALGFMTVGFAGTATAAPAPTSAGTASSVSMHGDWNDDDDSLVNVSDNNVGPFQVCNNNVPTNVLGVQVPVSDLAGALGFSNDGNLSSVEKNCDQDTLQDN